MQTRFTDHRSKPFTATHGSHNLRNYRLRNIAPLVGLLALGACAGAKVESSSMAPQAQPTAAPAAILVDVQIAPDAQSTPSGNEIAEKLRSDLVKDYGKAGISSSAATSDTPAAGIATLHVRISRADPGNKLARLVVGFGAGRSWLKTDTTLDVAGDTTPMMTLATASNSGRKPGLILPGGIAAATGNLTHLAIGGGLDLALTARSGLAHEADRSAKLIVTQTKKLYQTVGWTWSSPDRARA